MKRIILFILFVTNIVVGQSFVPNAPELNLKSYMLIEPKTNTVIAESNASGLIEPASMTKVMTAYVVEEATKNMKRNNQHITRELTKYKTRRAHR
jgi:D-alanyl-D-alanine carboxypeptidase (penicillin-binding protein 5/6)